MSMQTEQTNKDVVRSAIDRVITAALYLLLAIIFLGVAISFFEMLSIEQKILIGSIGIGALFLSFRHYFMEK